MAKKSDLEGPLSTSLASKKFMIKKWLYPYQGTMPKFLETLIKTFRWKRFFQGVTAIRLDIVKMFYKGYINKEEHYAIV